MKKKRLSIAKSLPAVRHARSSKPARMGRSLQAFLAGGTLLTGFTGSAYAANGSWNVNAAGNWATAGSWLGSTIPGSTTADNPDVATFGFTLTAARTATVDTTRFIGGISFGNTSAFGYTLATGTLRLNNGGTIQTLAAEGAHTNTISSPIVISGTGNATATFTSGATTPANGVLAISGALSGSATTGNTTTLTLNGTGTGANILSGVVGNGTGGGKLALLKDGLGTWALSNAANTFTGGISLRNGTLNITTSPTVLGSNMITMGGAGSSGATLITGQNLANAFSITAPDSGVATLGSNGTTAAATFSGPITLNNANLTVANPTNITTGSVTGTGGVTGTGNLILDNKGTASTMILSGGALDPIGTITLQGTATGAATISANIGANVTGLTQNSATSRLILSGTNSYSGPTTISAGTLQLATRASLYNGSTGSWTAANLKVAGTGTLAFNVGGTGEFSSADVTTFLTNLGGANGSATTGFAAGSSIGFDSTNAAGGTFTVADPVSDSTGTGGGALGVTKSGINTVVLSGANTYTGTTVVGTGTLQFQGPGALPAATAISLGSATLQIRHDGAGSNGTIALGNPVTLSIASSTDTIDVGNNGSANTGNTVAFGALNNGTTLNAFASTLNFTGSNGYLLSFTSLGLSGLTGNNTTLNPTTTSVIITGNVTNQESGTVTAHFDTLTLGGTSSGNAINGVISDNAGFVSVGNGDTRVTKSNTSIWTLTGNNTYSGPTAVNGGTLILSGSPTGTGTVAVNGGTLQLDYSTNNTGKIHDLAVLTLGSGSLDLKGGSHTEVVASTTLTAGTASSVSTSTPGSLLQMNTITRNAGASVNFAAPGIATTNNTNTASGILGPWATVGGSDLAVNSTNAAGGLITAYSSYTDVTRRTPGTIADGSANNVRLVEGSGSPGNLTLGAAITTIDLLNQSASGGSSAATIDPAGQTLRTNGILMGTGAGALTLGTGTNNGTLSTATAGGELLLNNQSPNGFTIHAVIANNTSASSLAKAGPGPLILSAANTWTGNTAISGGSLQLIGTSQLNGGAYAGTISIAGGATLQYSSSAAQTLSGIISGGGALIKDTASANPLILTGVNTYSGSTTLNAGTLQLGNAAVNGTVTSGLYQLDSGTTLYLNYLTAVATANAGYTSRLRGSGTLRLNSAQTATGIAQWGANSAAALPFDPGFTGTLQLDNGRIDASPAGLGGITTIVINPNAQFLAWTGTYPQNFSVAGTGWGETGQTGALRVAGSGNNAVFNGNITLTGDAGINSQDTTSLMTINGIISGGFSLTKVNLGRLILNGANTYTGNTILTAGTLSVGTNNNLGGPAGGLIFDGGTLQITGTALTSFTGSMSGRSITFNAAKSAGLDIVDPANTFTVEQDLSLTTGNFTKLGAGTLTSTAANTYTGTTFVAGGVLNLTGNRTTAVTATQVMDVGGTGSPLSVLNISGDFPIAGASQYRVGVNGPATVNHTAGTTTFNNTGSQLTVGVTTGMAGIYNLSGGTITIPASSTANRGLLLGVNAACNGTFNLSGTGTLTMAATSQLQIGRSENVAAIGASGTFNQTGGTAVTGELRMGGNNAGNNASQTATLNLSGGTFSAAGFTALSGGDNSVSAINISGTADVTLPAFPTTRGTGATATITFNGGTLKPAGPTAVYLGGLTNAFIKAGGAGFDTTNGDITITQALLADPASTGGGVTKAGVNTLTLAGTNTFTGNTTVSAGTLAMGTINANNQSSTVTIAASGATLQLGYTGTDTVSRLFIGASQKPAGIYGHTNSGATNGGLGVGAMDAWFAPGTGTLTVTSSPGTGGYNTWAAANAPTGTAADDFDGDGVPNALEYVLGGTKNTNDLAKLPQLSAVGGNMVFTFTRDQASIDGTTNAVIEVGTALSAWPTLFPVPAGAVTANPGVSVVKDSPVAGQDAITLTLPQAPDQTKFAHLKVTVVP